MCSYVGKPIEINAQKEYLLNTNGRKYLGNPMQVSIGVI
jgi:hypothetical protein